jgi:TolA-binding protein
VESVFSPPATVADGAQGGEATFNSRSSKRFSTRLDAKSLSESIQALEQGSVTNAESDTIINMSKQLSHMAQEIESLKIQVFQTSEALKVFSYKVLSFFAVPGLIVFSSPE